MRNNCEPLILLLVDDDSVVADLLSSWLATAGVKSIVACNGRDAIDEFRRTAFSAVVLDLDLGAPPDGFGVLEAIRAENLDIPVIMMSGMAGEGVKENALQKGARAFLDKPFEPDRLLRLLLSSTSGNTSGGK